MNSRWLWNLYQRHRFLRAEASRHILKFKVSEKAFAGVLKSIFHCGHHVVLSEYTQDWKQCHRKLMFQVLHDITEFKRFADLNLFKYAFHGIENWERGALQL